MILHFDFIKISRLWIILLLLITSALVYGQEVTESESKIKELQDNAIDMLNKLPSQSGSQKAKNQVQDLFDYYDNTVSKALPGGRNVKTNQTAKKIIDKTDVVEKPKLEAQFYETNYAKTSYRKSPSRGYRDPFALTNQLVRHDLKRGEPSGNQISNRNYNFTRLSASVEVPKLTLRGLILKSEHEKAAILEVEGLGTYVVREGDTVSIPSGGMNNVIKVTEIGRLSLLIEVGKLGEVIVVR
ncbi:hypothetical protein JCM30760_22150 [Thiomicrorhabdus hydrogeniphila]